MEEETQFHEQLISYLEERAKVVRSVWKKCQPYQAYSDYCYFLTDDKNNVSVEMPIEIKWAYLLDRVFDITVSSQKFILHLTNGTTIILDNELISGSNRDISKRVRQIALREKIALLQRMEAHYRSLYLKELTKETYWLIARKVNNSNYTNEKFLQDFLQEEAKVQKRSDNYKKHVKISRTFKKVMSYALQQNKLTK